MWGFTAVLPVFSALVWLGTLLGMLIYWCTSGRPQYPSMEDDQTIAYISDVGAFRLKPLFITGSAIMVVTLDASFLAERWLRHTGRLAPNTSRVQKGLSGASIIFAIAGAAGLILLSCFDTNTYPNLHDGFLLLFIAGYILSAICVCAEYQRLGIHYRNHRIMRISFWVKLSFILIELVLAIAFVSTTFGSHQNVAACLEWAVALIFTFYILSFVLDLLPSVQNKKHVPQGVREAEKRLEEGKNHNNGVNGHDTNGTNGYGANGYQQDGPDQVLPQQKKKGFGRFRW